MENKKRGIDPKLFLGHHSYVESVMQRTQAYKKYEEEWFKKMEELFKQQEQDDEK